MESSAPRKIVKLSLNRAEMVQLQLLTIKIRAGSEMQHHDITPCDVDAIVKFLSQMMGPEGVKYRYGTHRPAGPSRPCIEVEISLGAGATAALDKIASDFLHAVEYTDHTLNDAYASLVKLRDVLSRMRVKGKLPSNILSLEGTL
jgi:hypothetical protein